MKLEAAIISVILYIFGQGNFIFIREKAWNFLKLCLRQPCATQLVFHCCDTPTEQQVCYGCEVPGNR